jgi:hypothetical protein
LTFSPSFFFLLDLLIMGIFDISSRDCLAYFGQHWEALDHLTSQVQNFEREKANRGQGLYASATAGRLLLASHWS